MLLERHEMVAKVHPCYCLESLECRFFILLILLYILRLLSHGLHDVAQVELVLCRTGSSVLLIQATFSQLVLEVLKCFAR